ncbi:hypothetical protein [Streptomyces atroolivaceus]|uniref:hypothetical protein n=1 Tax=Streptomyces atroolivaceus TaxID=66869 RepID=UPI003680F136
MGTTVTAMGLAALGVFATSGTAHATAGGCTGSDLGQLCQTTYGDSYHVGRVEAELSSGYRCDIGFMVVGTLRNGQAFSNAKWASCGSVPSTSWSINQEFKNGSQLCVKVRTKAGSWLSDRACIEIED